MVRPSIRLDGFYGWIESIDGGLDGETMRGWIFFLIVLSDLSNVLVLSAK